MATVSISFGGIPDKSPYFTSDHPNGANFTSRGAGTAATFSGALVGSSASLNTLWSCDINPGVDNFTATVNVDTPDSSSRGVCVFNSSGNGFMFIARNTDVRVFTLAAWALSGSPLATYSATISDNDDINVDVTQSTGTYVVKRNATTLGTYVNTLYTSGLNSGFVMRGLGRINSFTLTYTPAQTIDTITNPLIPESAFSGNQTGFANGAITVTTPVIGGGTVSSSATVSGGTYSGTYATPVSGAAYPIFGSTQTHTFTQSSLTATISSAIGNPAGFSRVTLASPVTDDLTYITANLSPLPVTGDLLLYRTADFVSFLPDGTDEVAGEITTQIVHQVASTGVVYIWDMTINEAGVVSASSVKRFSLGLGLGIGL